MSKTLFRKNVEPSCSYCNHASDIGNGNVMCIKRGVVSRDASCSRFSYDPFKRRPPEPIRLKTASYSEEDFSL